MFGGRISRTPIGISYESFSPMGMNAFSVDIVQKVLALVPHRPVKMVALGYPDILLSEQAVRSILGDEAAEGLNYRADSKAIVEWHCLDKLIDKVPDPHHFFSTLGVELSVVDLKEVRGGEIVCNLNEPIADELRGTFDIVFDGGTMEHCFNVSQAIANILSMAKVDGYICHANPMTMVNHGFYNFSPTFYYDFYVQNGHKMASKFVATRGAGLDIQATEIHPTNRQHDIPIDACVTVVVRKCNADAPEYPLQSKYLHSPDLKPAS